MRVQINNQEVIIPSSLREITLRQKIDFQETHGKILEEMAKSITEMPDNELKELEIAEFHLEQMFRTFSFFSGISEEVLKDSQFIDTIANIYYSCLAQLHQQEDQIELDTEFVWNDEMWYLAEPELKHGDKMKFGEFIDAKQMIQNMVNLGHNQWECLIPICAIFLRKKDEAYEESFLYDGSERLQLMETVPLDIALQVGFFLNGSLNMSMRAFQSSLNPVLKEEESTSENTSKTLAG